MPYTVKNDKNISTVIAFGRDIKEVFNDGARGVLSIPYDIEHISGVDTAPITVHASGANALFQDWIKELFAFATLREVAVVEVEVHSIQQINNTDMLLTATVWTTSLKDAKKNATGIEFRDVRKGSALCKEKSGLWQCEVIVNTTA